MIGSSQKKPRARSKRRVPITAEFAADICELILEWRGALTWERIVEEAERVCGHRWTRQGLNNHEDIKKAYKDKTKGPKTRASLPDGDIATLLLLEKSERQEIEIQRLKERLNAYDELFILHQANAHRLGITPAELAMPLLPVERRRARQVSDGEHQPDISLIHPTLPGA